jgi:hypothetical protein
VATGQLGTAAGDMVCTALGKLPATAAPGQVEGVLADAVPELLARWTSGDGLDDELTEARAQLVREVVERGLADTASTPTAGWRRPSRWWDRHWFRGC